MADDDSNPTLTDDTPNHYEQRQAAKRERLEELADKARREAEAAGNHARRMASVIPFGQPILVGHHSEGRDRRYRARISATYDRSYQLSKKADYYEQRAESVGKGGISSDDPAAVVKLREELVKLERLQDTMKKANALVRKNDRAGLAALGFSESRINQLFTPDFAQRIGFPSYAITNNGANMRRIRKRIAELQRKPTETTERQVSGGVEPNSTVTVREDATENRVMLIFPGKPSDAIRQTLKGAGFKWSPNRGAWVRFLNNAGRAAAQYVVSKITEAA